jgi:prepilin-type processing-associated H-X9-DG protein
MSNRSSAVTRHGPSSYTCLHQNLNEPYRIFWPSSHREPNARHAFSRAALVALQAEAGVDPEGGGALVLSHTGEGHGPNSPSGLAHGDQYWAMHPGGANFLFAEGSVRFIKELVGFTIFQSLATKAGGEVLSADQF